MPLGEEITNLTKQVEVANTLEKASSGVMETIAKTLKGVFDTFIQPVGNLLAKSLYEIWKLLQPLIDAIGAFVEFFKGPIEWFNENVLKPLDDWIQENIIKPVTEFLSKFDLFKWIDENITKPFWSFVESAGKWIDEYITQPFFGMVDTVSGYIDTLETAFWLTIEDWIGYIDELATAFWGAIDEWNGAISGIYDTFVSVVTDITSDISEKFQTAIDTVKGIIGDIAAPFREVVDKVIKMANNALAGIVNSALDTDVLGDALRFAGLKEMEIQSFATGGVVQGTGPQLAVVHGGETVVPAGQSGGQIVLNFYGYQDDVFIRKVKDVIRKEGAQYTL